MINIATVWRMGARLAPAQKFTCSNHFRVIQLFLLGHILAISLNNISRYIEDDISSLSSVNMGDRELIPARC